MSQQLGIISKNAKNGLFMGRLTSLAMSVTIALRPINNPKPRAPKYDVLGLNKAANDWVVIGAMWEYFSNSDGSAFLSGSISDPSIGKVALVAYPRTNRETDVEEMAVNVSEPRSRSNAVAGEEDDGLGDSTPAAKKGKGKKEEAELPPV
jgi:uncharacterized protein (DUF736 family)